MGKTKTTADFMLFNFNSTGSRVILPLEMRWEPKEDITVYELAQCLPYLLRISAIMPYEINQTEKHFRHFVIIDHNPKLVTNAENKS